MNRQQSGDQITDVLSGERNHRRERSWLLLYGLAVLTTGMTLVITLLFRSIFKEIPFLLFWLTIIGNAWYGGFGPGLLTTVLAAFTVDYFLLGHANHFVTSLEELSQVGVFIIIGSVLSLFFKGLRRTQKMLRLSNENLDTHSARDNGWNYCSRPIGPADLRQ